MAGSARKLSRTSGPSFKTRVANFWRWYADEAARLYRAIEDKKSEALNTKVSAKGYCSSTAPKASTSSPESYKPKGTSIEFFAYEKLDRRIVL